VSLDPIEEGTNADGGAALRVANLQSGYASRRVISGVSLKVNAGEPVGIIGHNGAGKSTLLRTIMGTLKLSKGDVEYADKTLTHSSVSDRIRAGIALVPSERFVFAKLSVLENLALARDNARSAREASDAEALARELFPVVWERGHQQAGTLSGGEQRMVSLAMALMWSPKLLLLDEPTIGLSPLMAERVFTALSSLVKTNGMAVLCVEQNLGALLSFVQRVYVMRAGEIVAEKLTTDLADASSFWEYF
jgi:branched-chain amino acid transport system ATP-binding protein